MQNNSECLVCTDSDEDGYYAEEDCGPETDCNDYDGPIYPGAPEFPNDGFDQDCDGEDFISDYVVWYMDNVRCWDAPRVYATNRDAINLEEDTCDIPGGGINCDIKVEKVEMQGGFRTLESAQDWFCSQITTEWFHYWCNNRGQSRNRRRCLVYITDPL